jgi:Protein of unknown function (DUF3237)
MKSQRHLDSFP